MLKTFYPSSNRFSLHFLVVGKCNCWNTKLKSSLTFMCYFHHLNETFSHLKQSIFWPKLMLRICIQGGLAIVYLLLHWENLKTLQKEGSKNHSEKMTSLRSNCKSELNSLIPKIHSVSVELSLYWPSTKLSTFKSTKWVFRYKLPLRFLRINWVNFVFKLFWLKHHSTNAHFFADINWWSWP